MTRSFQLIVFDFDGTLADTYPWFSATLNEVARRYGFRCTTPAEREQLRDLAATEALTALGVPAWKRPWITRHLRQRLQRDIATIRCFPGIDDLLARLTAAGVRLAVASSNSAANVHTALGTARLGYFAALECGIALGGKASRLRRLLRRQQIPAAAALYIGDEVRDLEAARQIGMGAGAVTWGYNSAAALRSQQPDFLFHTPAAIAQQVLG